MKREISKPPRIALCRICEGTGRVVGEDEGEFHTCIQCEGSGRIIVSSEIVMNIRPYKCKQRTNRII